MAFFRNVKKIVNLRFSELNQSRSEKPFFKVKIANRLNQWGKHPSWQVLVFGLIIIGGISIAQYLWPLAPNQAIFVPHDIQEEITHPAFISEPEDFQAESIVMPPETVTITVTEDSNDAETEHVMAEQTIIPVTVAAIDWSGAVKPVTGQIGVAFGFGYDEFFDDYRLHRGIDYIAPKGAPVIAVLSGTVKAVFDDELYGKTIAIDHGEDWHSVYSQLEQVAVKEGQKVIVGEKLAVIATPSIVEADGGTHLHFELIYQGEPVDPAEYLK